MWEGTASSLKSLQSQRQKPDEGCSLPVAYCRFWSFAHFHQVLNIHWMLERALLSEDSKLVGQNIYCMVTFNYRREFPIWHVYVPTYKQWQEDANTGRVEGIYSFLKHFHQIPSVLEIPRAPAWALTHCCLLLQKEESGTESEQPAGSSAKGFHQGDCTVTISPQKINSQDSEFG